MNDALYELLVARRPKPYDLPVRILIILLIVAVIFFGMPFIGVLAVFIAVLIALAAYYLIFPRLSVEYEYILLNHDLQIDIIYNRSKRKPRLNIDIQNAEIIAPKDSPRLNSYRAEKVHDFSSGRKNDNVYAIMIPVDKKNTCILIEPDAKMLDQMQQWMGMKMYRD